MYSGDRRDPASNALPSVANGIDMAAVATAMFDSMTLRSAFGTPLVDAKTFGEKLAKLPDAPDESLR